MIEYLYKDGKQPCEVEPLKVRVDGRVSGEIRKVDDGFQYFPKGSKTGGDVFSTVLEVQKYLVGD